MPIRFHPAARSELAEAVNWYEDDYPGRGERFRRAVERELSRVLDAPASFPRWRRHPCARSVVIPRFPYTAIFAIEPRAVMIYAIAHDKRRPGYWRRRLA
jgi:toxin ParE1/3/4